MKKSLFIGLALIVAALGYWLATNKPAQLVREHSPIIGPDQAPVTLVEFVDPACEACRAMFPYVKQIMKEHPNQIKLVVRYMNFHKESEEAIRILEAARKQGAFENAFAVLFAFQPVWAPHGHEGKSPWEFISKTDINIAQAKQDAHSSEIMKNVHQDMQDAKAFGVQKTPSFFVNGAPLKLLHPDALRDMVQQALAKNQEAT